MFFFDFDGPILDVSERYFSVYARIIRECGGNPLLKDEYWNLKRNKISEIEIISESIEKNRIEEYISKRKTLIEDPSFLLLDTVLTDLFTAYTKTFTRHSANLVTLRSYPQNLEEQLLNLNIRSWFHQVLSGLSSDQVDNRWQIKVRLIQQSGLLSKIKPENCTFVGDTETDIITGKMLGMKTIAVCFGIRNRDILCKYQPDLIFDTPNHFSEYLMRTYI
jgi:phosphoglycolate phosphatase-like HAD superfamily hydrolase